MDIHFRKSLGINVVELMYHTEDRRSKTESII